MKIDGSTITDKILLNRERGPYNSDFFNTWKGLKGFQPTLFWQVFFHNNSFFNDTKWDKNFFASKVTIPSESIQVGAIETGYSVPKAPIVDGKSSPNTFVIGFYVDIFSTLELTIHQWLKMVSRTGVKNNISDISVYGYLMGGAANETLENPCIQYKFHECFPTNIAEYTYDHTNQKWANVRNVTFGYRDYDIYIDEFVTYFMADRVDQTKIIDENYKFDEKNYKETNPEAKSFLGKDAIDFVDFLNGATDTKIDMFGGQSWIKTTLSEGQAHGKNVIGTKSAYNNEYLVPLVKGDGLDNLKIHSTYNEHFTEPKDEPYNYRNHRYPNFERDKDVPSVKKHEKNRNIGSFKFDDPSSGYFDVSKTGVVFGKILKGNEKVTANQNDDQTDHSAFRDVTIDTQHKIKELHEKHTDVLKEKWRHPYDFGQGVWDVRETDGPKYESTGGTVKNIYAHDGTLVARKVLDHFFRFNYKTGFQDRKIVLNMDENKPQASSDIATHENYDTRILPHIVPLAEYPSADANPVEKLYKGSTPLMNLLKTKVTAFLTPDTPNYHGSLRAIAKVIRKVQQWFYTEPKHKTAQKDDVTRIWEGQNGTEFMQGAKTDRNDVTSTNGHGSGDIVDVSKDDHTIAVRHSGANLVDVDPNDFTFKNRHGSVETIPVPRDDTPSNNNFGDSSEVDVGIYDVTTHESHQNVNEKNPDVYDHLVSDDARSIDYIYVGEDTVDVNGLDNNGVVIRADDIPSGDVSVKEIAPNNPDGTDHKEMLFNGNDQVKERYDVNRISNPKSDELNTSNISVNEKRLDPDDTPSAMNISVDERYSDLGDVRDHKSIGVQIKPNDEDVRFGKLNVSAVAPDTMNGSTPGGNSYSGDFERRVSTTDDDVGRTHSEGKPVHVNQETVNAQNINANVVTNRSFTGDVSSSSDKNGKVIPHSGNDMPKHEKTKNIVTVKDDGAASNIGNDDIKRVHLDDGEIDVKKLKVSMVDASNDRVVSGNVAYERVTTTRDKNSPSDGVSVNTVDSDVSVIDFAKKLTNMKLVYSDISEKFEFKVKRIKSNENNEIFDFDGKAIEKKPYTESVPDTRKITINTIDVNKINDKVPSKRDLGKQVNIHDFDNTNIVKK